MEIYGRDGSIICTMFPPENGNLKVTYQFNNYTDPDIVSNTMIINDAHKFGLADLYQLRGRVGRFDRRAFAYLIVRDMSTLTYDVQSRLEAIKKYQELGSGFKIAMRDLEMRGAGNILGVEQSGFIDQVGFDLYCRLLKEEINRLKAKS